MSTVPYCTVYGTFYQVHVQYCTVLYLWRTLVFVLQDIAEARAYLEKASIK